MQFLGYVPDAPLGKNGISRGLRSLAKAHSLEIGAPEVLLGKQITQTIGQLKIACSPPSRSFSHSNYSPSSRPPVPDQRMSTG
jgi:hypothetical protein